MPEKPTEFKIGDRVRVKGFRTIAKICCFSRATAGAIRLDRDVDDFRWYNVSDVVLVAPRKEDPDAR